MSTSVTGGGAFTGGGANRVIYEDGSQTLPLMPALSLTELLSTQDN